MTDILETPTCLLCKDLEPHIHLAGPQTDAELTRLHAENARLREALEKIAKFHESKFNNLTFVGGDVMEIAREALKGDK